MHELSIAQSIVEQAHKLAIENKGSRVLELDLQIGELSGVVVECLEFVMPEVIKGTILEDCKFNFEKVTLELKCLDCGALTYPDIVFIQCEHCFSRDIKINKGKELLIRKMEIE